MEITNEKHPLYKFLDKIQKKLEELELSNQFSTSGITSIYYHVKQYLLDVQLEHDRIVAELKRRIPVVLELIEDNHHIPERRVNLYGVEYKLHDLDNLGSCISVSCFSKYGEYEVNLAFWPDDDDDAIYVKLDTPFNMDMLDRHDSGYAVGYETFKTVLREGYEAPREGSDAQENCSRMFEHVLAKNGNLYVARHGDCLCILFYAGSDYESAFYKGSAKMHIDHLEKCLKQKEEDRSGQAKWVRSKVCDGGDDC